MTFFEFCLDCCFSCNNNEWGLKLSSLKKGWKKCTEVVHVTFTQLLWLSVWNWPKLKSFLIDNLSPVLLRLIHWVSELNSFTFTFMHLADAFIQSNLQCIRAIRLLSVCVFRGNWTHNLCANFLLTQCSTTEPQEVQSPNSEQIIQTSFVNSIRIQWTYI